jgi:hypothetical protein
VAWQQREGRKSLQVAELSTEKTVTLTLVLPALLSEQQAIPSTRLPTVYETTVVRELSAVA